MHVPSDLFNVLHKCGVGAAGDSKVISHTIPDDDVRGTNSTSLALAFAFCVFFVFARVHQLQIRST